MNRVNNFKDRSSNQFFGTYLLQQLDYSDTLIQLAQASSWAKLEKLFSQYYTKSTGRPPKPIRLMIGLLILKQLEDLSDEEIVLQLKRNPYYQVFCGLTKLSNKPPCYSTELVKFRDRIGKEGIEKIFQMSVQPHDRSALEYTVNIDTTV